MAQLEGKLKQELCLDGQVVACRFKLPSAPPSEHIEAGVDTAWRYTRRCLDAPGHPGIPSNVAGQKVVEKES